MAKIRSEGGVVCDAGPIIHLDEVKCLNLIKDFQKVVVPDCVCKEVIKYRNVEFQGGDVNWVVISSRYAVEEPILIS